MEFKKTFLEAVGIGIKTFHYTNQISLSDFSKIAQVEPLTIVTTDCINLDYVKDVLQCQLNLFSAYYLQAIALMTKVNDVKIIKTLEQVNPNRSLLGLLMGMESYSHTTLFKDAYKYSLPMLSSDRVMGSINEYLSISQEAEPKKGGSDLIATEVNNLSVGKLIDVEISIDSKDDDDNNKNNKVVIPVMVRLLVSALTTDTVMHILAYKTEDISLKERFYAWRSGRISFIKDLILCQDLIDNQKKALIQDKSNTLQEIHRRADNSKAYGLLSQAPSLASASNIFIISEREEKLLSMKLGGKLSNSYIRQKAFRNTYAMSICVIDRERERVTFYSRDMDKSTDVSVKEIKTVNNSGGPNIAEILKTMMAGSAPISF